MSLTILKKKTHKCFLLSTEKTELLDIVEICIDQSLMIY